MIKRSLPIRILLISLIFLQAPILIYFFLIFRSEFNSQLVDNYFSLLEQGTCRAADLREVYLGRVVIDNIVVDLLKLGEPQTKLPDPVINEKLEELAKQNGFANMFYLTLTPEGKLICTASADKTMIGLNLSENYYFRETLSRGNFGFLSYGNNIDEKRFYVAQTIFGEDKKPVGIFAVATTAEDLLDRMLHTRFMNYPLHFSLITPDEIVFASSDPTFDLLLLKPLSADRLAEIKKGKEIGSFITEQANVQFYPVPNLPGALEWQWQGLRRIGTKIPLEGMDMTLLIYADEEAIFKTQYNDLFRFIALFCIITAFTSWLTFWITERMARPLKLLRWIMQRIGKGDYSARFIEDRMGYEINEIGQTLNEMIANLLNHMEQVKNERVQKETLANELKIGREIQLSILPQEMPLYAQIDIHASTLPAKEVGGDFYDFYLYPGPPTDKKLAFTIADAAGKGISACLYSLCLRSMIRSYIYEYEDVGRVTKLANNLFCQDTAKSSMFVTAFIGMFDPKNYQLNYVSAGHHPAVLRRADGTIERLTTEHIALGAILMDEVQQMNVQLHPGDLLVLYTDGVTEAFSASGEAYGEKRIINVIQTYASEPVERIWNEIVEDVHSWSQGVPQSDDITLIVMRIRS